MSTPGRPLDPETRALAESRFGHDFSKVSIHAGASASASARALGASAYTVGRQIVFGESRLSPTAREARQLLGHELAHVVQQGRGGPAPQSAGPALERSADAAGVAFASGALRIPVGGASRPGIACQPAPGAADTVAVSRVENEDGTWSALNRSGEVLYSGPLGPVVDPGLPNLYETRVVGTPLDERERREALKQYMDPAWVDPLSPIGAPESYDPTVYDHEVLARKAAERKFDEYDRRQYEAGGKIYKRRGSGRVYWNDIEPEDRKELSDRFGIQVSTDPHRVVLPIGSYAFETIYEGKLLRKIMEDARLPPEAIHQVAMRLEAETVSGAFLGVAHLGTARFAGQGRYTPRAPKAPPARPPRARPARQGSSAPKTAQPPAPQPAPAPQAAPNVSAPAPKPFRPSRLPAWVRSFALSLRLSMQGVRNSPLNVRIASSSYRVRAGKPAAAQVTPSPTPSVTPAPTPAPTPATVPLRGPAATTPAPATAPAPVSAPPVAATVAAPSISPVATPAHTPGNFTIGVSLIGVHAESDAPLTSRRGLSTNVPDMGTQMGAQTQIGPELVTAINGVPVTSRDPNILLGADTARFRADALAIILADANHPLAALVDYVARDWVARPYRYGNMALWEQNPVDWQAGHAISNRLGGADVIILQSRYRNQIQSARSERRGAVAKDEYYDIGGIAVDPLTAWDLYSRGLLPQLPSRYPKIKL